MKLLKSVLALVTCALILSACETSTTQTYSYWHYTPFSDKPEKELEQATTICIGVANYTYTSCMAAHGWKAELRTEMVKQITCKKKNGEKMKIKITPDACLYNGGTVLN